MRSTPRSQEAEEAIGTVSSQSQSNPAQANPMAGFGPNEWLVDEIYQSYLKDPNSVDKAWWDFFTDYQPQDGTIAATKTAKPAPAQPAPAQPAPTLAAPAKPAAAQAPPAKAADRPIAPPIPADAEVAALRGPAARVVTNMEASLHVPTATSVRAVPAKLLIDNRIVINNHLKRARGGKVSFTHLVGWALVKALKSLPEMNASYAETGGKPTLVKPQHINLGLAIDMQKPDGTRQLLVPSIKAAESMNFAEFWMAYEDIVRRARDNKLALPDFQGTTI